MNRMGRFFLRQAFCILSLFSISVMSAASWVQAADVSEVNAKLDSLQKEIAELKANSIPKDNVVTGGNTRGSFKLPGTNTSITIGGYVKAVVMWDSISAGGAYNPGDVALATTLIPVGPNTGGHNRSQIHTSARQSRLTFATYTPSEYGPVKTYFSGDFNGTSGTETATNSHGFRVREFYGSLGHLTIGQTWSNITSFTSIPEFFDRGGPAAILGGRQLIVKWDQKFNGGSFSISAENPDTFMLGSLPAGVVSPDDDKFPDVTGAVRFNVGRSTLEAAGLVRFLHIDNPLAVDSATGWAVIFNGNIPTFGKDEFKFQLYRGDGFGRYIGGLGEHGDAMLINGKIQTITRTGATVAYRHYWTPKLRSNLILSGVKTTNPSILLTASPPVSETSLANRNSTLVCNLIWSPVPNVKFGPEYGYGERRIQNGKSGHLHHVGFYAQYNFF